LTSATTTTPARAVTASAPGKLILAGEHAAVYGRPALVAAVDARLTVHVSDRRAGAGAGRRAGEQLACSPLREGEPGIELVLPDVGVRERVSSAALRDYASKARDRWSAFAADPTPERFRALRGGDAAHLAKIALGEVLLTAGGRHDPDWIVRVESAIPPGSGMGSSAAMAAALVTAALEMLGLSTELADVEPLVLEVERRQHGSPSGVDGAIVLRGGVQWVERGPSGLAFEALPASLPLLGELRVLNTGTPGQTTGEVVTAVRQLRASDPAAFDTLLDRLEEATRNLRDALIASDRAALADAIHHAQRGLERAGVVPPAIRDLVRGIETRGGAAKISGAGALAGPGAGCLVIYHPHPATLHATHLLPAESLLPVRLGGEGVRVEST
jgi:mevalonate kinase